MILDSTTGAAVRKPAARALTAAEGSPPSDSSRLNFSRFFGPDVQDHGDGGNLCCGWDKRKQQAFFDERGG